MVSTGSGDRQLFFIGVVVEQSTIAVHPLLAPALCTALEHHGLADCDVALRLCDEAPIPAGLAMYGGHDTGGCAWVPPGGAIPAPMLKGQAYRYLAEFDVLACLDALIDRLERLESFPILPPNMNAKETAALQTFDAKLAALAGQKKIKESLRKYVLSAIYQSRQHSCAQRIPHIVITGPSGVGKSMMVRVFRDVLHDLGLVNDKFIEVSDGSNIKCKVRQVMQNATGGVLWIDEAYQLKDCRITNGQLTGAIDPQGFECGTQEASGGTINALVIVSGYQKDMMDWLSYNNAKGNNGLSGRFSETFEMLCYSEDELIEIADLMLKRPCHNGATLATLARTKLRSFVKDIAAMPDRDSQNARAVEKVLDNVKREHGARVVECGLTEVLGGIEYTEADVDAGVEAWRRRSHSAKRAAESSGAGGSGDSDAHHVRLSPRAAPNPRAQPTTCSRAPTHARASPVCTRPTD